MQFGGQTAIKLTKALTDMGVKILGTDADDVDAAEDRERFEKFLKNVILTVQEVQQSLRQKKPLKLLIN